MTSNALLPFEMKLTRVEKKQKKKAQVAVRGVERDVILQVPCLILNESFSDTCKNVS